VRIIFIRHGRTQSNVNHLLDTAYPGAPLDEVGIAQAAGLPERLRDEPIELVATSDITRARQTGEPLASALGVPLVVDPGFREIHAGDWDMSDDWQQYAAVIGSWPDDPGAALPNGDDGHTFMARFDGAIAELADYDCVAVISHGGALRAWLSARGGVSVDDDPRWMIHNVDTVIVEGRPGDWTILSWAGQALPWS